VLQLTAPHACALMQVARLIEAFHTPFKKSAVPHPVSASKHPVPARQQQQAQPQPQPQPQQPHAEEAEQQQAAGGPEAMQVEKPPRAWQAARSAGSQRVGLRQQDGDGLRHMATQLQTHASAHGCATGIELDGPGQEGGLDGGEAGDEEDLFSNLTG